MGIRSGFGFLDIRGGLQTVPKGQYEAADTAGFNFTQPQAFKISIPNIVDSFIALFKDTTLVLIIGILTCLSLLSWQSVIRIGWIEKSRSL